MPILLRPTRRRTRNRRTYSEATSGAISILFQFRIDHFALTWHNTRGQITDTPVPQVLAHLAPTSVEVGSIVSVGGNGVTDALRYVTILKPKVFIPMHTDEFPSPSIGEFYRPFPQQAMASDFSAGNMPQLRYITARQLFPAHDFRSVLAGMALTS